MSVYYSLILYWKVIQYNKPERLVYHVQKSEETLARILLTERIWTRTTERYYNQVDYICRGVTKISSVKNIFRTWVKDNIPIKESDI